METGDLIRNKNDGKYAIVMATFTKFYQEYNPHGWDDYGVADTAVRIQYVEDGTERTRRKRSMNRNWQLVSTKAQLEKSGCK